MQERTISTTVGPELEGVRLDHFLTERFTYQSRTGWQAIIREGRIAVNGIRVRASRRLHAGDVIAFDVRGLAEPEVDPTYSVVLDRPRFLVVSKSGCLPVHPSGCYFRNTLLMLMKERYGELFIVNRLDRETSGLVVLAKDAETAGALSGLFASRQVEKTYLAAVFGAFPCGTVVKKRLAVDRSGFPGAEETAFHGDRSGHGGRRAVRHGVRLPDDVRDLQSRRMPSAYGPSAPDPRHAQFLRIPACRRQALRP